MKVKAPIESKRQPHFVPLSGKTTLHFDVREAAEIADTLDVNTYGFAYIDAKAGLPVIQEDI